MFVSKKKKKKRLFWWFQISFRAKADIEMSVTSRRRESYFLTVSSSVSAAVMQWFSVLAVVLISLLHSVKQKCHSLGKCYPVMHLLTLQYLTVLLTKRISCMHKCLQDWFLFVFSYVLWSTLSVAFTLDSFAGVLLGPEHLLTRATGYYSFWFLFTCFRSSEYT